MVDIVFVFVFFIHFIYTAAPPSTPAAGILVVRCVSHFTNFIHINE